MWEKIKDISNVVILPAIVLYLLGLLCITAYLARFGIVSFDIINARFVTAGFFPLFGLAACVFLALHAYRNVTKFRMFVGDSLTTWPERQGFYFQLTWWAAFSALGITSFFNLGRYTSAPANRNFSFAPLGQHDLVGAMVARLPTSFLTDDIAFVLKVSLEVFCYLGLLVAVVYGIVYWSTRNAVSKSAGVAATSDTEETRPTPHSSVAEPPWIVRKVVRAGMRACDVLWVSLWATIFFWAAVKLQKQVFDFGGLGEPEGLSTTLFFAWLFENTVLILGFLVWLKPEAEQLSLGVWATRFRHPGMFDTVIQQILIPVFVAVFTFGATIFPRIPFAFGGGEPREITLKMKMQSAELENSALYLIGESNQFLFVVRPGKGAFEVNKDSIEYVQTRKAKMPDAPLPEQSKHQP